MNPSLRPLARLAALLQQAVKPAEDTPAAQPAAPADAPGPTRTLAPGSETPSLDDLSSSVAGEEDPGAALDSPAPPPRPGAATGQ